MAITATLVDNVCHQSLGAAADAYFGAIPVALDVTSSMSYQLEYLKISGIWYLRKTTFSSSGVATINFTVPGVTPVFPDCDATASFFDGMQIGWGVVAAMAAAFSVIFIKKAFFR